ncbi:MAG TPA: aldo/keto reductase [Ignavibacteriaceae bacterium]|nr:aldo/keto reductase [Ignavibacteriaceae bacterium]
MHYSILGKTGLKVSKIGFGSYRVDYRIPEHSDSLSDSILSGFNLIDTSSNYSDGGSEILIGKVVHQLIENNLIKREDLVIVSKGGYLQGKNLEIAKQKEIHGTPFPEVTKCSPELWHCIHPDFLENQISYSLERMKLDKIDIYLLHNPEYFLNYNSYDSIMYHRKEYYRRIKQAFIYLEEEVKKGRIGFYGISSNTFPLTIDYHDFTSLSEILKLTDEISSENYFGVIQLPMNLIEKGGLSNDENSVLRIAQNNNIGVLVNRPLNAIVKNKLYRLASFPQNENYSKSEILKLIKDVAELENRIRISIEDFQINSSDLKSYFDCLSLGEVLSVYFKKFDNPTQFIEMKQQYFIPRANYVLSSLNKLDVLSDELTNLLNTYAVSSNILLDAIQSHLAKLHDIFLAPTISELNNHFNNDLDSIDISQRAIHLLQSLEEVSSVLVGMRKRSYVKKMHVISELKLIDKANSFFLKN